MDTDEPNGLLPGYCYQVSPRRERQKTSLELKIRVVKRIGLVKLFVKKNLCAPDLVYDTRTQ